jgi:hypothetical protein
VTEPETLAELTGYTLTHSDPAFIHQYVVDAWAAQTAGEDSKPIGVFFALVGLYLHLEERQSGRQVQRVHQLLANRRKQWPRFPLPAERGNMRVTDVMAEPPGAQRDAAIKRWCRSVWEAYGGSREAVRTLLKEVLG